MEWTTSEIDAHQALLAERVFQTENKWPQFKLLLKNMRDLGQQTPSDAVVISMERTLLYGGFSLIAPFFGQQQFISIDSSPESADERGAYNAELVNDPRFIKVPYTRRAPIENTGLAENSADLILVPNLVHHVENQKEMFKQLAKTLKPNGILYIFEPTLRELHQIPDDYIRYTPYGMETVLKEEELEPLGFELEGGPFSAIAYCWTQALQYFPNDKRQEMEEWFYAKHFPQLMSWDNTHTKNLVRDHTSFPVAFSIKARKPA